MTAAPLRAIDEVDLVDTGADGSVRLHAVKRVSATDPYMPGHFPGLPMLPAVFLLESVRQAVVAAVRPEGHVDVARLRSVRLLEPMWGGDRLVLDITVQPRPGQWSCAVTCRRGADGPRVAVLDVVLAEGAADPEPAECGAAPPRLDSIERDHAAIRAMLPVRHPMQLVDRVAALDGDREIHTVKAVTGSEPCYAALTDADEAAAYAYPRSLLLESFGQSAALLWLSAPDAPERAGQLPVLAALRDCRFHGRVQPGELIRHVVRIDHRIGAQALFTGQTWAGNRQVASIGTLIAASRPAAALRGAGTPSRFE